MRKVIVFNHVTLDGYFADANSDMSWAHTDPLDAEWNAFMAGNATGGGGLLLGRITYDLMAAFWPTPAGMAAAPAVAQAMTRMPKVVFSRTRDSSTWQNTAFLRGDIPSAVRKLKQEPGEDLAILGSGSIVAPLAEAGLIDEYQIVVNPLVLGKGKSLFTGVARKVPLTLTRTRAFGNGNVLLCYQPKA
jgi:dihydrofolate reductase